MRVKKETRAALPDSFSGAGAEPSNVSVVKKGVTAWSIAEDTAPPNIFYFNQILLLRGLGLSLLLKLEVVLLNL